jgi:ABC-type transport system substrate-binding protein
MEHPPNDFKRSFYRELRRQLEALGIRLEDEYYRSTEKVKDFDRPYLLLISRRLEFPGPEDLIGPLFASDSSMNLIRYVNVEMERLLEEAELEKSWSDRNKLFFRIQKILNSEMPAVPLFTQQNQVAVQPFVRGIKNPPLGFYYLKMKNIRVVE